MLSTVSLAQCRAARPGALLLSASLVLPPLLAGCGGAPQQTATAPPPPAMTNTRPATNPAVQPRQGMTTKQKVVLLAGAAALYYLYRKHQNAQAQQGPEGKYFISKSTGRVYYRNLKTGEFQWVSPPQQPIQVPYDQAQQYSQYSGYNNRENGQTFGGYGPGQENYTDTEPASVVVR